MKLEIEEILGTLVIRSQGMHTKHAIQCER